jgi:hypothetical protein
MEKTLMIGVLSTASAPAAPPLERAFAAARRSGGYLLRAAHDAMARS